MTKVVWVAIAITTAACAYNGPTSPTPVPQAQQATTSAPTPPPPAQVTPLRVMLVIGPTPTKVGQRTALSAITMSGTPTSYDWTLGDGQTASSTDAVLFHTYDAPGFLRVSLTAHDAAGQVSTDYQYLEVDAVPAPPPPPARALSVLLSCGSGMKVGDSMRCSIVAFTEGGASVPQSGFGSVRWDFGDGNTSSSGIFPFTDHAYSVAGPYLVRVDATDADGRTGTAKAVVEVKP